MCIENRKEVKCIDIYVSGGALLAKYSYKKLSQNEAEFIPDDCSEYKTPIIKAERVRVRVAGARGARGNTDDPAESGSERLRLLDTDPGDTGTESGMSCSEACSTRGLQYCSDGAETTTCSDGMSCSTEDTGTQYCSRDAAEELGMPDYDFSVHYPLTLREEDCDWGKQTDYISLDVIHCIGTFFWLFKQVFIELYKNGNCQSAP